MSKIKLSIPVLVFVLLSLCTNAVAQFEHPLFSVFDKDSLAGFDENAARAQAIAERFLGPEFKIKMYRLKREYIDHKYGLVHAKPPHLVDINTYLNANRPAAIPGCVNEDFEASTPAVITASNQVTGWVVTGGLNDPYLPTSPSQTGYNPYFPNGLPGVTSCNLLGCCPMPPAHSEIIDCSASGGYYDATIGSQYHIFSVFGTSTVSGAAAANPQISAGLFGTKVLRLNDEVTGDYSLEKLSKTFSVTAQNAIFQFAFISVFAPGHACCDAGGFQIRLSNATAGSVIPCPNFSVSAPSTACTATVPVTYYNCGTGTTYSPTVNFGNIYHPWKVNSMDLSAYIGQNITIDIIVSDCNAGGHFGCVYFDAQCGPMTVYGNGNPYDAGTNVTVPTCGAAGATICAADGLGPYSWAGPNLPANYSTPSMTNQCITTSISAQYTLYMQPEGSCSPISRVVNSAITPAPLLNASAVQAVCGASTAVITLTPSGSASVPSTITWSPTPLLLSTNTLVGTYTTGPTGSQSQTVSITASDPLGCKVTATVNINPAPPTPSFSIVNVTNSPSITCITPSIDLDIASTYSYNGGSLTYSWSSASSTFVTTSITAVNPGTYTAIGKDPVTQCLATRTIVIGSNTTAPSSVISPTFQNVTCSLTSITNVTVTANPTVNVTHMILAPQGGTFSSTSYSATYLPGGTGTFTYCLRNDINGCTTCKEFSVVSSQGFPTFNVTSPQNFSLGCTSRSCAVINIVNGNTSQPPGGAVSYTVIPPGSSSVTPGGALSVSNTYTVCTAGTYTVITKDNTSFCETRVPISILENTVAPGIAVAVDRVVLDCNHPRVTLHGSSNTPNTDLSWIFEGGATNTQQGDTITSFAVTTSTSLTHVNSYTFVVEDLNSTCKSTSVTIISQNLFQPKVFVSNSTSSLSCKTPTTVLTNVSSTGIPTITGYPANLPVIGYLWEGPTPQEPLSTSTTYTAQTVGVYTLTAQDLNNGCFGVTTTTITDARVYPDLSSSKLVDTLDCGQANLKLFALVNNGTSGLSYAWSTPFPMPIGNPNSASLTISTPGEYGVVVTNSVNGCTGAINFKVVNGSLTASFAASTVSGYAPLTVNFTNNSASSQNNNIGIFSSWNYGNGTTSGSTTATGSFVASPIAASISPSATYNQPGTYTVTMYTTRGGCLDTAFAVIHVDIPSEMEIPNVFTPNGDGVNDLFWIHAKNLSDINIVIFDRWGHKVYELDSTTGNIEWDGKNLQGKDAAAGIYFYTIKATGKDDKAYDKKGTISLFR